MDNSTGKQYRQVERRYWQDSIEKTTYRTNKSIKEEIIINKEKNR